MKLFAFVLSCLLFFSLTPAWAAMEIEVANVQELVAQIGSNRELRLAPGTYDLGEAMPARGKSARCTIDTGLAIYNVHDLKLVGSGAGETKIISPIVESDVLTFTECSNIQVKDLSVGHRVIPGGCQGDAVVVRDSRNVEFLRTDLYGCGQFSLTLRFVDNILVKDSKLHDCSYGLVDSYGVRNGKFVDTQFDHTGKLSAINISNVAVMSFENCRFFIDPNRKAFSYENIPAKECVAYYSLCSKRHKKQSLSARKLSFTKCEFSHVNLMEINLLKEEGVTFEENKVMGFKV